MPKWLISAPLVLLTALAVLVALPVLIPVAALLSLLPPLAGALRATLFICCYLVCEAIGIAVSGWLWVAKLIHRGESRYQQANFRLQCWWAASLLGCATRLFDLRFTLHNTECLAGDGAILLSRHASIADTVLPMTCYAIPQNIRMRYVLKRELLWDPCLEIVGKRLPNYFVDRASRNTRAELDGVVSLLQDLPANAGVLLYPEGTRFSRAKHDQLREKSQTQPELLAQLDRWPDLLPPRLGGTIALLGANPGRDVLFCAHTGFGGSANFAELVNGAWAHSEVHVAFWRIAYADIPRESDAQRDFLFAQWDRMQQSVEELRQSD